MKVLLLAGEESGVLYAERLRRALPGCEFQTYQDHYKTSDLAVMGFWAVIKRIFFFLGVQRTMKRVIREWHPDVVVTIDYPGLNLKLAAYAKARGSEGGRRREPSPLFLPVRTCSFQGF